MALVYCRECGKQVSDQAPTCPNCGAPQGVAALAAAPAKPVKLDRENFVVMVDGSHTARWH